MKINQVKKTIRVSSYITYQEACKTEGVYQLVEGSYVVVFKLGRYTTTFFMNAAMEYIQPWDGSTHARMRLTDKQLNVSIN